MATTIDGIRWWERPDGFLYARIPDGAGRTRTVLYHRYVVEQALGRRLRASEQVLHADGDPRNNAPDNLVLRPRVQALRERLAAIPPGANRGITHRPHRPRRAKVDDKAHRVSEKRTVYTAKGETNG